MPTFKTQAIVIAKRPLWDADRLYILYTPDYGKIEAQVKSAAAASSKLAGSLEPISLVQAMIVKGKKRETIAGVQLLKRYQFNDLATFAQISLIRELFLKLIKEGVREKNLYQNLIAYLDFLERSDDYSFKRYLTQRFIWQMVEILGFGLSFRINQKLGLSKKTKKLLQSCLDNKPPALQISSNLLQELESFTKKYLHNIVESELYSFRFFSC